MTTTAPTFTRRTSAYTIRVRAAEGRTQAVLQQIAAALPNVSDLGDSSVTFRHATDDAAALQVAIAATEQVSEWASFDLTTGLGIHRRSITREVLPAAEEEQEEEAPAPVVSGTIGVAYHVGGRQIVRDGDLSAMDVADQINEAHAAGTRLQVNGREVKALFGKPASSFGNGTLGVEVVGRKARTNTIYVKVGQAVTVEVL